MGVSKNTALLVGFGVVLATILVYLLWWEYTYEYEFLGKLASAVTIGSLIMAPAIYFFKKRQDVKDERSRASENLHTELENALDGLNEKKHQVNLKKVKLPDGKDVYFMNRMLNHDFYDSLVFSGKINFLPPKIQQLTQDTFQKIKDRNTHIRKIREIEDDADASEDISQKTLRYYEILGKIEEELLADIPVVKERLRKEYKIG